MAFRAVIHTGSNEQMQEIFKVVAKYRAEKAIKQLVSMGVTTDTLQDILHQEKTHNTDSKAG